MECKNNDVKAHACRTSSGSDSLVTMFVTNKLKEVIMDNLIYNETSE